MVVSTLHTVDKRVDLYRACIARQARRWPHFTSKAYHKWRFSAAINLPWVPG